MEPSLFLCCRATHIARGSNRETTNHDVLGALIVEATAEIDEILERRLARF
jgi:hypothetical protein